MATGREYKPKILGFLCNWCFYAGAVREEPGINYLKVVTDFSQQDLGQLKTRIAAALEMNTHI